MVAGREIFSSPHVAPEERMGLSFAAPLAGRDGNYINVWSTMVNISIHAPLAGCDGYPASAPSRFPNFNPRTPCGVRRLVAAIVVVVVNFNPRKQGCNQGLRISIHAPLAGCDSFSAVITPARLYFNPRTPCGVRRRARAIGTGLLPFQSTHPLRGATIAEDIIAHSNIISIHAPLAGCDGDGL